MSISIPVDIFHGELTPARAQVFVRIRRMPEFAGCALTGFVHGPFCEYAHTLPAKFTLQDLGPGPTLLARATLTDPCLWTSDLPQLYNVHFELQRAGQTMAAEKRQVGLRGIGTRSVRGGGQIVREGKVWVPRGCSVGLPTPEHVQLLREQLLVGVCDSTPALDLLAEASRRGLYLMVKLDGRQSDLSVALAQLARWPAVMMAIITGVKDLPRELQQAAPNLLLAQGVEANELPTFRPAPWAHAAVVSLAAEASLPAANLAELTLPLFWEQTHSREKLASSPRETCDLLQRRLTPLGQFAGYLIHT